MIERRFPAIGETVWQEQLPNGLTIQVVPKAGAVRKSAYLFVDYGSMDMTFETPQGLYQAPAGVAHYLEHKLFDMPDGRDISEEFTALGASSNAFTDYTMTAYLFTCTDHFDACLQLLLEMVFTPYFTPETVEKERGIIAQEIRMYGDTPESAAYEALAAALFAGHPAAVPIAGTEETIANITAQTLQACYDAFYTPANMVLTVVGDVDPEQVASLARQWSPARSHPRPGRRYGPCQSPLQWPGKKEMEMDIAVPCFQLGFRCDSVGKGQQSYRRETVGDLAADLLFGEGSPLYQQLYDEGLIDSSFGGGYEDNGGAAMLTCSGDSDDPEAVANAIVLRASQIARDGVEEAALQRLIRSYIGRRVKGLDSFGGYCYRLGSYYLDGADYLSFQTLYPTITGKEICEFIREYITKERMFLTAVYPKEEENEDGIRE